MGAKSSNINRGQNNRSDGHLLEYARSTFVRGGGSPLLGPSMNATGGNIADALAPGNGYAYHTFTSPGTITFSGQSGTIEILMVAGGGAGGYRIAGGGGAGGILHGTMPISPGTYVVEVGKGGWSDPALPSATAPLGGSPTNFYLQGATFPNPSTYARAYGGGGAGGYAHDNQTPDNPGGTYPGPNPSIGGGAAGGSSGGAGSLYGVSGYPGFTSITGTTSGPNANAAPPEYIGTGYPHSPITPAPYTPVGGLGTAPLAYGSDAPVPSPAPARNTHPAYYDQGLFPTTYYMGLRGWGNNGGMCYGPSLAGGGAGGGGAGAVGQDRGTPPDTSNPTDVRGADGGDGKTFTGFTAPLFCDPSKPNGATVKSTLDPLGGYFAGGGGGANYNSAQGQTYGGGKGGNGGGGCGRPDGPTSPPSPSNFTPSEFNTNTYSSTNQNAVLYSGGGGGGGGYSYGPAGSGGPGIIIIRYTV